MLEKEKTEVSCPGGGRPIRTTYGELARKSSLRSSKGHEYRFKSSDQSKMKRAMDKMSQLSKQFEQKQKDFERDMERAQKEFSEAYGNVIGNADILIKK
jgi:cytochrome c556